MDFIKAILGIGLFSHLLDIGQCTVSCHFDEGLCGWNSVGTSMFRWQTHSAQTMDRTSGPLNDVTCKNRNGQYAYIPGSFSRKDEKAVLESETVILHDKTNISFWYSMKGVGIGSLEVVQKFDNGTKLGVWSRKGEQNKDWRKGSTKLNPGTFTLWFECLVNLPYGSDIAIDDVVLESENIGTVNSTSTTLPTTRIEQTYRTEFTTPAVDLTSCLTDNPAGEHSSVPNLPGSCDFEKDLCGLTVYTNEIDTDVTWVISDHAEKTYDTASIQWDHTLQNASHKGHYLNFRNKIGWLKIDKNPRGRNASVETPVMVGDAVCLSFWYIMPTKDANLLVYITDVDGNTKELWTSENITKHWSNVVISIKHNQPFKVGFQSRNENYNAKVALDDITLTAQVDVPASMFTTKPTPGNIVTTVASTVIRTAETTPLFKAATISTEETSTKSDCYNTVDNCDVYADDMCVAYEPWARAHCNWYCGFCTGPTTPPTPCKNNVTNCKEYGTYICTDAGLRRWTMDHCREHCGLCQSDGNTIPKTATTGGSTMPTIGTTGRNTLPTIATTVRKSTEQPDVICRNKVTNCEDYGPDMCKLSVYRSWAKDHCDLFCGFCSAYNRVSGIQLANNVKCPDILLPMECTMLSMGDDCCPIPQCPLGYVMTIKSPPQRQD